MVTEQDVNRLCDRLVRHTPETATYRDEEGREGVHYWSEPPLIGLLREAIHPDVSTSGGGGGRAAGSPAPLSVEAVNKFMLIEKQATDLYWENHRGPAQLASLEGRVLWLNEHMRSDPARRLELHRHMRRWVLEIETLLDPAKVIALRGHRCPSCHNEWAMVREGDELFRRSALSVAVSSVQVLGSCAACLAEWPADSLVGLGQIMRHAGVDGLFASLDAEHVQ